MAKQARKRFILFRGIIWIAQKLSWPFKKVYRYFKPQKIQDEIFDQAKENTNSDQKEETKRKSTNAKDSSSIQLPAQLSLHKPKNAQEHFTSALTRMVINSLQRKVHSLDSLGDGIFTFMVKPIVKAIIGQQVSVDDYWKHVQFGFINDEVPVKTEILSEKLLESNSLFPKSSANEANPTFKIDYNCFVIALIQLERLLPIVKDMISSEISTLPAKDVPQALLINGSITRYFEAVEKILFDQLQEIILKQKDRLQVDFASPGLTIQLSSELFNQIKTFIESNEYVSTFGKQLTNPFYVLPECEHINIKLEKSKNAEPVFIVRERMRTRIEALTRADNQLKHLIPDSKCEQVITEMRDLTDADTFARILFATILDLPYLDADPNLLSNIMPPFTDEDQNNIAADYYIYRLLQMYVYLNDEENENDPAPTPGQKRFSIIDKALEIAQDGADVVVDILDDIQDLTGVNAAKKLASLKSWIRPRLLRCIPGERIPALLENCDPKILCQALAKLPQKHLRHFLCCAFPELKDRTTSQTPTSHLMSFAINADYLNRVLQNRGKNAAEETLWLLLDNIPIDVLAEAAADNSEKFHLRFLNNFAKLNTIRITRTPVTTHYIQTPIFFTRTFPTKADKFIKKQPKNMPKNIINELNIILALCKEVMAFQDDIAKILKLDIHFVLFRMLDIWLANRSQSNHKKLSNQNAINQWMEKFNAYQTFGASLCGFNFKNTVKNITVENINTVLASLIEKFPNAENTNSISDELCNNILRHLVENKYPVKPELIWARRFKKSDKPSAVQNLLQFLSELILNPDCKDKDQEIFSAVAHLFMGFDTDNPNFILFATLDQLNLTGSWCAGYADQQIEAAWKVLQDKLQFLELIKAIDVMQTASPLPTPIKNKLEELVFKHALCDSINAKMQEFEQEITLPRQPVDNTNNYFGISGYLSYFYKTPTAEKIESDPLKPVKEWKANCIKHWNDFINQNKLIELPTDHIPKIFSYFLCTELNTLAEIHPDAHSYFEELFKSFIIKEVVPDQDNNKTNDLKMAS